jgi:predicted ester cyclase
MPSEKNKAIARRFFKVWGKGELHIIDELASPTLSVYYPAFPQALKGIEAFKQVITNHRSMFTNPELNIEDEIAEGDKVVISWSMAVTHQGSLFGIPGTGKRIKWTGITIYRIVDGKVVDERGEEDYLSILRPLGLLPEHLKAIE